MLVDLLLLAVCGGLYSVPLYAIVQEKSEPSHRARMIAANNVVNALMMVLGAGFVGGCSAAGVPAARVLQIAAVMNLGVTLWIVRLLPQSVFRDAVPVVFPPAAQNPHRGAAEPAALAGERSILVINHLSFLDGCLVAAFLPGDLIFAIDSQQARRFWFLKYVIDIFPVDPMQPDGDSSDGEGGAGGASAGHFSGGSDHPDRRADENL